MKEDVRTCLFVLRACWAGGVKVRIEACAIFARWGMIREGVSHATERLDVIPRDVVEEVSRRFITNSRFENFLLVAYW